MLLFRVDCNSFLLHVSVYRRHFDSIFTIDAINGIIQFRASTNVSVGTLNDFIRRIFKNCSTIFTGAFHDVREVETYKLWHIISPCDDVKGIEAYEPVNDAHCLSATWTYHTSLYIDFACSILQCASIISVKIDGCNEWSLQLQIHFSSLDNLCHSGHIATLCLIAMIACQYLISSE